MYAVDLFFDDLAEDTALPEILMKVLSDQTNNEGACIAHKTSLISHCVLACESEAGNDNFSSSLRSELREGKRRHLLTHAR
jgi:hypothetical protein